MKRLSVLGLVLVASCASGPPKGFPLPDGRTGYTAFCNGRGNSMASCYRLAGELCGGPYEVVDVDQSSSVVGVNGIVAPVIERNLHFTCEVRASL